MKIASMRVENWSHKGGLRLSLALSNLSLKDMEALKVLKDDISDSITVHLGTNKGLLIFYSSDE